MIPFGFPAAIREVSTMRCWYGGLVVPPTGIRSTQVLPAVFAHGCAALYEMPAAPAAVNVCVALKWSAIAFEDSDTIRAYDPDCHALPKALTYAAASLAN